MILDYECFENGFPLIIYVKLCKLKACCGSDVLFQFNSYEQRVTAAVLYCHDSSRLDCIYSGETNNDCNVNVSLRIKTFEVSKEACSIFNQVPLIILTDLDSLKS